MFNRSLNCPIIRGTITPQKYNIQKLAEPFFQKTPTAHRESIKSLATLEKVAISSKGKERKMGRRYDTQSSFLKNDEVPAFQLCIFEDDITQYWNQEDAVQILWVSSQRKGNYTRFKWKH